MMGDTHISWATKVWNPVVGCSKVSSGCASCYAVSMAYRLGHIETTRDAYDGLTVKRDNGHLDWTGRVRCLPERLGEPLRWRKPCRVFVNSMSDLFHEEVPVEFIDQVFAVMALAPQHTFKVLTKRPERMAEWAKRRDVQGDVSHEIDRICLETLTPPPAGARWEPEERHYDNGGHYMGSNPGYWDFTLRWPLPNVWLGVSAEDQKTADERIPLLLDTPAAVRWVSAEPLLGPVELGSYLHGVCPEHDSPGGFCVGPCRHRRRLSWVVIGGESGPRARTCCQHWISRMVDQCKEAGVPVFVKQTGSNHRICGQTEHDWTRPQHYTGKGEDMDEWPPGLRVREWPEGG